MMSVVSAVRDLGRLREISTVLVRHGFGEVVARVGFGRKARPPKPEGSPATPSDAPQDGTPEIPDEELQRGEAEKDRISTAERIRLVLQDLGPSFIKLGQIASTRSDLLPPEIVLELKKLQNDVPPVPYEDIKAQVETSLGRRLTDVYLSFDEVPLATASIGQVHRAVIQTERGPEKVVVKVQRPGVSSTIARDMEVLGLFAAGLERAVPETKIYSPVGVVQQLDRSITAEIDFLIEADNAERFARNFDGHTEVRFPKVYREASSKQVLTLEFFDGVSLGKAVEQGYDGKIIAKRSLGVIVKMAFEDGFFHADPHPGNIIIMGTPADPVIGLIDLGMVGRLGPEMRDRIIDLMLAAARNDPYAVADALYALGRPTRKVDMRDYRTYVAGLAEKYLGRPLKDIQMAALIRDLVEGAMKFGIEVPPDFLMVGKALMTIEGIGKELDPDLDIFGEATPHFQKLLMARYSPQRIGNEMWRGFEQLSKVGYDVPLQLREVLDDLRMGRLAMKASDPEMPKSLDRLGRRVLTGLVVGSTMLGGALVAEHGGLWLGGTLIGLAVLLYVAHVGRDLLR